MPSHSHNNPKTKYKNLLLSYSYLSSLLYVLHLPQINLENKPGPYKDALIKCPVQSTQNRWSADKKYRTEF